MDPLLGMALWPAVLIGIGGLVWGARAAAGAVHAEVVDERLETSALRTGHVNALDAPVAVNRCSASTDSLKAVRHVFATHTLPESPSNAKILHLNL